MYRCVYNGRRGFCKLMRSLVFTYRNTNEERRSAARSLLFSKFQSKNAAGVRDCFFLRCKLSSSSNRDPVADGDVSASIRREKDVKTIEKGQEGGAKRGSNAAKRSAAQKRRDWRRRDSVVKSFVMVDRGIRTKASAILSRALAATRKVDGRCTATTATMVEVYTLPWQFTEPRST